MATKKYLIITIIIILLVFVLGLLLILKQDRQEKLSFFENLYNQRLEAMATGDIEKFNSLSSRKILQAQKEFLEKNPEIIPSDYFQKQYEISRYPVLEKHKLVDSQHTASNATLEYEGSESNEAAEGGILYIKYKIIFVKEENNWKIDFVHRQWSTSGK